MNNFAFITWNVFTENVDEQDHEALVMQELRRGDQQAAGPMEPATTKKQKQNRRRKGELKHFKELQ